MGLFKQLMIFGKTGRQGRRNGNSGSASANGQSILRLVPATEQQKAGAEKSEGEKKEQQLKRQKQKSLTEQGKTKSSVSPPLSSHSSRHFPPLAVRRAEQRGAAAWLGLCALPQSLRPPCCAPAWVTLFLWAFSRQGATGVPLFTTWDSVASSGRAPIPGNISGRSRPRF